MTETMSPTWITERVTLRTQREHITEAFRWDQKYFSYVLCDRGHLEGQLVCGLGRVTLGDVGSSDGRDVD